MRRKKIHETFALAELRKKHTKNWLKIGCVPPVTFAKIGPVLKYT